MKECFKSHFIRELMAHYVWLATNRAHSVLQEGKLGPDIGFVNIFLSEMRFMFDIIKQKIKQYQTGIFEHLVRAGYEKAGLGKKSIHIEFGDISYLGSTILHSDAQSDAQSDPVILMLHGFGAGKETWLSFVDQLSPTNPMLIPDLPGHGESSWDDELDYSIHSQTNRIHDMLLALQIHKVHVIGHSMGGAIALRLAHLYPEIVTSLVLISAAGAEIKEGKLEKIVDFRDLNPLVDVQSRDDYKRLLEICMNKPPYIPRLVFNLMADKKMARFDIDKKIFTDIAVDIDQSTYLQRLRFPTLILWGDCDQVLNVADANYLNENLIGSQKLILAGIGHIPMIEDPVLTSKYVSEFWEKLA